MSGSRKSVIDATCRRAPGRAPRRVGGRTATWPPRRARVAWRARSRGRRWSQRSSPNAGQERRLRGDRVRCPLRRPPRCRPRHAASARIDGVPMRSRPIPSHGSNPAPIANWSRRANQPQIGWRQLPAAARRRRTRTRAHPVRRSGTCTCTRRRAARRPRGDRPRARPAACERSHTTSAPAAVARAVSATMSTTAAVR